MPWGDSVLNIATPDQTAFQLWQTQGITRAATERAGAEPMESCEVYKDIADPMPSVRDILTDIVKRQGTMVALRGGVMREEREKGWEKLCAVMVVRGEK